MTQDKVQPVVPVPSATSSTSAAATTKSMVALAETQAVSRLRWAVLSVLLIATALMSAGTYLYTRNQERQHFETAFADSAQQVMDAFHGAVERNLNAVAALSSDITSHALSSDNNESFPFVTLPDFAVRGSNTRSLTGSHILHYIPIVREEDRTKWEDYALENRFHIDEAFEEDMLLRARQDAEIGMEQLRQRNLQQQGASNATIYRDDDSGYHLKIWRGPSDAPDGASLYMPLHQRSPINGARQRILNMDVAPDLRGAGVLETILEGKEAVVENAIAPDPDLLQRLEANLRLSQYREHVQDYTDGLSTYFDYPVFNSFGTSNSVVGVLTTNIYWKNLFSYLLSPRSQGIICVVENSFDQTFSYRLDGPEAVFLGMVDLHDSKYKEQEVATNVNDYLRKDGTVQTRAYVTVGLSDKTQYTIRVFPSQDTEDLFLSNEPVVYTLLVIVAFSMACLLFLWFSYAVERRHRIMIANVVENAERAASTEREINEFLAHEVRNPLSAALSACSFIVAALQEDETLGDPETRKNFHEDIAVVDSSLNFINDFLRSTIDIYRASEQKLQIAKIPTDILLDVFQPVAAMQHTRQSNFKTIVDCPENLVVEIDALRLKQVVLNLVGNASKFVERGFIRLRAEAVDNQVWLYIEDSGPGIRPDMRKELFSKYQLSLDLVSQGTGLGLNLSKTLMESMGGDIWLDETYESGVEGSPGASFVIQLCESPLDINAAYPSDSEQEIGDDEIYPICPPSGIGDDENFPVEQEPCNDVERGVSMQEGPGAADLPPLPQDLPTENALISAAGKAIPASYMPTELKVSVSSEQQEQEQQLPNDLSVLFVDDDAILRKLFSRACKKVGPSWKFQQAASGHAALMLCESEQFDLIFMDQYMPSVDKPLLGTETVQLMRAQGIQCIICGLSANNMEEGFMHAGADDFVLKPMPCKPGELKELLLNIFEKSQGHVGHKPPPQELSPDEAEKPVLLQPSGVPVSNEGRLLATRERTVGWRAYISLDRGSIKS